jgi:hypothetical protein
MRTAMHINNSYPEARKPMNSRMVVRKCVPCVLVFALLFFAGPSSGGQAAAGPAKQRTFTTPEEAMNALVEAGKAKNRAALADIFGPEYEKLLSGDEIQDNNELEQFAAAVDESAKLEKSGDSRVTLTIGKDNWPFPIPIVKAGDQWRFDTAAGMEEILNRRIGENELSAISTCRAYVLAQWEYFTEGDHDNDGVAEYAQKLISSPGVRDGLYWETAEDEKPSPLGELIAAARTEGYSAGRKKANPAATAPAEHKRSPYHGYYVRILKRQGAYAPGGKYDYVINGNMIAGYALIAYPDKWGSSGIMTFIVNQQGRVYQKNLGPDTVKLAAAITEYDPDATWKPVKE